MHSFNTARKNILLILFFGFIYLSSNCKKNTHVSPDNPYGLPNATQTGANTFACLINGSPFISYYNPSIGAGATMIDAHSSDVKNDTLAIGGQLKPNGTYGKLIFLHINSGLAINEKYNLGSIAADGIYGTDSTCIGISTNATTSYAISGTIQLTKLDTLNKIVSGFFNGIFPIPGCDTLQVSDGRFDYQFRYY